jgi:hypothetical protein
MPQTRIPIFSAPLTSRPEDPPAITFLAGTDKGLDERLSRIGRALLDDTIAEQELSALARLGCQIEFLCVFLVMYVDDRDFRHVRESAVEAAKRAAQFCRDVRRVQKSFLYFRQNPFGSWYGVQSQFDSAPLRDPRLEALCAKLEIWFMPLMKTIGSERGAVRKERLLFEMVNHLRTTTENSHFAELAHLVQVAQAALDIEPKVAVTPETLEKKYQRYNPGSPVGLRMVR